jgi:hypothetical protein
VSVADVIVTAVSVAIEIVTAIVAIAMIGAIEVDNSQATK